MEGGSFIRDISFDLELALVLRVFDKKRPKAAAGGVRTVSNIFAVV